MTPDGAILAAPPVTPALEAFARAHPGAQAYVIDPEFNPDGQVPGWAIRGYFPARSDGTLDHDGWVPNPHYRPGPLASGFPRPHNPVERALQLAATGYQPDTVLIAVLADATVIIPTTAEHPDQIPIVDDDILALFTHPDLLPPTSPRITVAIRDLAPLLPSVTVHINPGARPSVRLPGNALVASIRGKETRHGEPNPQQRS